MRRPSTGTCSQCGEPIFLYHCTDGPDALGRRLDFRVYVHERTGGIDTETCRIAAHPVYGQGDPR